MSTETKTIPLTQGRYAIVDADDYEKLDEYKWHAHGNGDKCYAVRTRNGRKIRMHREILEAPPHLYCDHINHNGLDNRRCNLRLCTPQQNQFNRKPTERTSKYKGVCWCSEARKWRATIHHNKLQIHIGLYDYEQDAAIAYDDYAIELFGEFAYLNIAHRPEIQQWLTQTHLFESQCNQTQHVTSGATS